MTEKEKTKICFLIGGLAGCGGIERVTTTVANALAQYECFQVVFICFRGGTNDLFLLDKRIDCLNLYEQKKTMAKAMIDLKGICKLRKIIKERNIDIIIACGIMFYPLAYLGSIGTGIPSIYVEHTNPENNDDFKGEKIVRALSSRLSKGIITISQEAKMWYSEKERCRKKVFLIYNPIPTETYSMKQYNDQSKKIVSIGRLSYQKNFEGLIDVAKNVLDFCTDWEWDIYGEGRDYNNLKKKIHEKKLENRLFLRGRNSKMIESYKEYSFLVMTSRYEGFPMVLIEAAANKLPLISYDIKTGPKEIIANEVNGYLVPFESKEKMADRIIQLIHDREKRIQMSDASYKKSLEFKIDAIKEQWCEMIHFFVKNRHTA